MPKPYNPQDKLMFKAKEEGYRARSVYKLEELDKKANLIKVGMDILDLGAAPGSWLQYISKWIGSTGRVLGLDLQQIKFISDNIITKVCDITDLLKVAKIIAESGFEKFDLIVSDLAPKTTGIAYVDQKLSVDLNSSAFAIAKQFLKPHGKLVMKIFPGEHFEGFVKQLKSFFYSIDQIKVQASRDRSREIYLICSS